MAGNSVRFTATIDDKVSGKLGIIGKKFDKTFGKNSSASLFGNVGAKGVALGFGLISDAASGLVGFLGDATQAAIDDAAEQANLVLALKNNIPGWDGNTDSINKYIDAQARRGFTDTDVRSSLEQLIGLTHDAKEAQDLNNLAEDLAVAKGIPLSQATDAISKAYDGKGKALQNLGVDTHGLTGKEDLLTAAHKNVDGAADAMADTMQGKMKAAQIDFAEAQEKLGNVILPVVRDLMIKFAEEWLPALGRGWDKVHDALKPVLDVLGWIIGRMQDLIGWIDKMAKKLDKLHALSIAIPPIPGLPFPHFATGGLVPGPVGQPTMAVVHGGERVLRSGSAPSGGGGTGVTLVGVRPEDLDRIIDQRLFVQVRRASAGNA